MRWCRRAARRGQWAEHVINTLPSLSHNTLAPGQAPPQHLRLKQTSLLACLQGQQASTLRSFGQRLPPRSSF